MTTCSSANMSLAIIRRLAYAVFENLKGLWKCCECICYVHTSNAYLKYYLQVTEGTRFFFKIKQILIYDGVLQQIKIYETHIFKT